jgi:hypothetical protein
MNALDLYQRCLTVVSDAVMAGDFAAYAAMIDLPYLMHTSTADLLVTTTNDLRPTFDALSQGLRARGITHYERIAREADYAACDRIDGWHHTHLIANGERVAYPYASRQLLVRRGDNWLFSEAHYAVLTARHWPLTDDDIFAHANLPLPQKAAP